VLVAMVFARADDAENSNLARELKKLRRRLGDASNPQQLRYDAVMMAIASNRKEVK